MATYYVSPGGTRSSGASTLHDWSSANCYPSYSAVKNVATLSGSVIEFDGGENGITYFEGFASNCTNLTIQASSDLGHNGRVLLDVTGLGIDSCYITHAGFINNKVNLTGAGVGKYNLKVFSGAVNPVVNDADIVAGDRSIYIYNAQLTLNRVSVKGSKHVAYSTYVGASSGAKLIANHTQFDDAAGHTFWFENNSIGELNACRVSGSFSSTFAASPTWTGSCVSKNCQIFANSYWTNTIKIVEKSGSVGSFEFKNCNTHPNSYDPRLSSYQEAILNDCIVKKVGTIKHRHTGIVCFFVDDSANYAFWRDVAQPAFDSRGIKGCWAINSRLLPGGDWTIPASAVGAGHELVNHTRRHVTLLSTQQQAFDIRYTGGACLMTVSQTSRTITTSAGGYWDLSAYSTVAGLISAIDSDVNYTCVANAINGPLYSSNGNPLNLKEVINVDIESTYTAIYDYLLVYQDEINGNNDDINSNIPGYVVSTLVYPGNTNDIISASAVKSAGLIGGRGVLSQSYSLSNINVYRVTTIDTASSIDYTSDSSIINSTNVILDRASHLGHIITLVNHGSLSAHQLGLILDTITAHNGVEIMTFSEACNHINGTLSGILPVGSTVDGGYTYTRTLVDQSDYHLRTDSPCLGAGTKISGLNTDIEDNPLFPPYNIGPFGLAEGALGVAPVVNDGAPCNNITRLTGTSTIIDPAGTYKLEDTNGWRVVTGWTAGTANDFFDADGVPAPFTGQQLIDAGIGYQLYYGQKGVAGYVIEQDAKSHKKIVRVLRVNTYIDSILYDPDKDYKW